MLTFFKEQLKKIYLHVTSKLQILFARGPVDESSLVDLERILIEADTGMATTRKIISSLRERIQQGRISQGGDLKVALEEQLIDLLPKVQAFENACVYLMVGVNGTGKTTCSAKLAHLLTQKRKRVLLVAADTFRAAAVEQLRVWSVRIGTGFVCGKDLADPASVVFAGCQKYIEEKYDVLIVDTAGRLQNKSNLMRELEKLHKVIERHISVEKIVTLLTIDSMLGQNSLDQARLFNEATRLDGIILTKMDSTAKGGIVFAIASELHVPVSYISYGEQLDNIKIFDPKTYVNELVNG